MMKKFFLIALLVFFSTNFAYAISDDFNVIMSITAFDPIPPSTPTFLTATPVAQTQIDLSWTASTDDVALQGYQVFRDATQIATTTLTTHSDTGLSASTSYTYYVTAFDTSFNYSSSSNVVATTTLPVTPTSTPTTTTPVSQGGNGQGVDIELRSLVVEPDVYNASLSWATSRYAQFELMWGRTSSYELGFVITDLFKRDHQTLITDLESDTVYEYKLLARDHKGKTVTLSQSTFKTLSATDNTAPANVSNLKVNIEGSDVLVSWDNPSDADFSHVRVVRSPLFYPTDPYDGYILYQGAGVFKYDANALLTQGIQYYTVFSYDDSGNISSGAIVSAYKSAVGLVTRDEQAPVASSTLDVSINDVVLIQNDITISPIQGSFLVDTNTFFTVRMPYDVFPEHLKAIQVTFVHPLDDSQSYSFLLRVNKDKTAYEALVAPLHIPGSFPMEFVVYDYDTKILYNFSGEIISQTNEKTVVSFPALDNGMTMSLLLNFLLLLALLCILIWFLFARKKIYTETV